MKNSINSLVPNEDARLALLLELHKCGGEGDTGYIVDHAMALVEHESVRAWSTRA